MSGTAEVRELEVGGIRIPYRLVRSGRRTLEITVAAGGAVEVRAPAGPKIERIEERLRARAGWIRRKIALRQPVETELPRRFVSGESHRYLGRQYRLSVRHGKRVHVAAHGGRLHVEVPDPLDAEGVRRALRTWFGRRARVVIPQRVAALTTLPSFAGLQPAAVSVRTMRTRWGSCSASDRLSLNAELVRLPSSLIDYVIAHELCHLRVRNHDLQFERLLARVMPDWRARHRRLARTDID